MVESPLITCLFSTWPPLSEFLAPPLTLPECRHRWRLISSGVCVREEGCAVCVCERERVRERERPFELVTHYCRTYDATVILQVAKKAVSSWKKK